MRRYFEGNDDWEPEDYARYFGVSGPGDDFMSVGPSPAPKPQAQAETSFLDSLFGEDEEQPMHAESGAAAQAAAQVVRNVSDDQGQFQHDVFVGPGGGAPTQGGSPIASGPLPGGNAPLGGSSSKFSLPLILGAAAGVLFFVVKKW